MAKKKHKNKIPGSINEFNNGRPFKYEPEELAQKIKNYYTDVDNNPIQKRKVETSLKDSKETIEYIKRPYTIEGLCNYLDITTKTFRDWEKNDILISIITRARQKIYANKMDGATAGVFNANIVALDLGLKAREDKQVNNILLPLGVKELKAITESLGADYGELPETIDINHTEE